MPWAGSETERIGLTQTGVAVGTPSYAVPELDGYRDGFAKTAPTGSFRANDLALHDLSGNVREICADDCDPADLRLSASVGLFPSVSYGRVGESWPAIGFRVVLDMVDPDPKPALPPPPEGGDGIAPGHAAEGHAPDLHRSMPWRRFAERNHPARRVLVADS